jgi:hypothetical protein
VLSLVVATLVAAADPPRVAVAAPTGLGFEQPELPVLQARLRAAVAATGALVVDVDAVAVECVEDPACVTAHVGSHDALVVVEVSRVGSDVEVVDRVWRTGGAEVARAQRSLSTTEFDAAPLSPEVTGALSGLLRAPSGAATEQPPAAAPATASSSPSLATLAISAGAVVGVAGLAGFAVEAGTLEDPRSRGADKERARVTSWVLLGAAVAGVGGAIAGGLLLPGEPVAGEQTAASVR